jgi:predicted NBD/HSP70 family sugar kinase
VIGAPQGPQPADFADVRATNLAVVLRYVRQHLPCSRAEIAGATGLNKATVSSLVADLIERRILRETGLTENRIGRPATKLVLDGAPYAAIGIEVGAGYLNAVAVDLAGDTILAWRRACDPAPESFGPEQAATAIAALAKRVLTKTNRDGRRVLGLVIGVPGLVGPGGVVRFAPDLGWRDADLLGLVSRAMGNPGFPVRVENDANLAVIAESRYGSHAGTANLIYLTGERGIGAGIISDGRLLRGARGFPGEIGHVQLDPAGPACACGRRGCLEAQASVGALIARGSPGAGNIEPDPELAVAELLRLAEAGDRTATGALAEGGNALGQAVSTLVNLLDPEVVVLGGYFATLAPWLIPLVEKEIQARGIVGLDGPVVTASILGHSAAAIGGAATILDHVDEGNIPQI